MLNVQPQFYKHVLCAVIIPGPLIFKAK